MVGTRGGGWGLSLWKIQERGGVLRAACRQSGPSWGLTYRPDPDSWLRCLPLYLSWRTQGKGEEKEQYEGKTQREIWELDKKV